MKNNQEFNPDKITLRSLENKLRSMPELKVPVTLRAKLLKSIPKKQINKTTVRHIKHRYGIWGFPAGAAAAMILIFIIVLSFSPSMTPYRYTGDLNDTVNNYPNDLNELFIGDSNFVNHKLFRLNKGIQDYSYSQASLMFSK
jgi:hypothetical protein